MPLVFATGAGSAARHSLGTVVFGGMLVSTFLNLAITPVLYVIIKSLELRPGGPRRQVARRSPADAHTDPHPTNVRIVNRLSATVPSRMSGTHVEESVASVCNAFAAASIGHIAAARAGRWHRRRLSAEHPSRREHRNQRRYDQARKRLQATQRRRRPLHERPNGRAGAADRTEADRAGPSRCRQGLIWTADFSVGLTVRQYRYLRQEGWLMGGVDLSAAYGFDWSTRVQGKHVSVAALAVRLQQRFGAGLSGGFPKPGRLRRSERQRNGLRPRHRAQHQRRDEGYVRRLHAREALYDQIEQTAGIPRADRHLADLRRARRHHRRVARAITTSVPFTYNPPDGPCLQYPPTRTAQYYAVAITLPFLKTPQDVRHVHDRAAVARAYRRRQPEQLDAAAASISISNTRLPRRRRSSSSRRARATICRPIRIPST